MLYIELFVIKKKTNALPTNNLNNISINQIVTYQDDEVSELEKL